jgi:flagellar biosynthetic protein FlhB
MSDDANKPHPATPKRRDEYRKEGKFPKARDTTAVASMLGVVVVVVVGHKALAELLYAVFVRCHGDVGAMTRGDGGQVFAAIPPALLAAAIPPALAAAFFGAAAGAWQSGLRFYPEMLKLKFDKLNPLPKLMEMANPKNASFELALAIGRVGIVGVVCYDQLTEDIPSLLALTGAPVGESLEVLGGMMLRMTLHALGVLVLLAVADYAYNRYTLEKQMRMSDQEVKEEMRQSDQDPKIKGKIRQKMREASRKRIILAAGEADVIVTNPTHISVAIRYTAGDPAPMVIAKGHDELAMKIRAEARKHGIPILENRALARALDAEVEIGGLVPGQHFVAVAKVLAFVYSLKTRKQRN